MLNRGPLVMFPCTGMGCSFDVRMSVNVGRCQVEGRQGGLLVASKGSKPDIVHLC